MKPTVSDLMGDGKTCSHRAIEERVMAAIKPQLDRADELLDYYTEGLPREVWLPIAYKFKPKTADERFAEFAQTVWPNLAQQIRRLGAALSAGATAFSQVFNAELNRDDLTEVGP